MRHPGAACIKDNGRLMPTVIAVKQSRQKALARVFIDHNRELCARCDLGEDAFKQRCNRATRAAEQAFAALVI